MIVLENYGSHVTLDVIVKAKECGLDVLTLLNYTSHHLQPLDVSIFNSIRWHFVDTWMYGQYTREEKEPTNKT